MWANGLRQRLQTWGESHQSPELLPEPDLLWLPWHQTAFFVVPVRALTLNHALLMPSLSPGLTYQPFLSLTPRLLSAGQAEPPSAETQGAHTPFCTTFSLCLLRFLCICSLLHITP